MLWPGIGEQPMGCFCLSVLRVEVRAWVADPSGRWRPFWWHDRAFDSLVFNSGLPFIAGVSAWVLRCQCVYPGAVADSFDKGRGVRSRGLDRDFKRPRWPSWCYVEARATDHAQANTRAPTGLSRKKCIELSFFLNWDT